MTENTPASARNNTAGGSAMAGGAHFQAQAVTWFAVQVLLRTPIGQNFGLPDPSVPERIASETDESLDDIRVDLSKEESLCCQCKRSLSLSTKADSPLGSTLVQCHAQLQRPHTGTGEQRFVVIYGESNGNLSTLKKLLERYRGAAPGTSLIDAARNKAETAVAQKMETLFAALESGTCKGIVTKAEEILRKLHLIHLQFEPGESDHASALTALQHNLLQDPAQVLQAMDTLMKIGSDLAVQRKSVGRVQIRHELSRVGIALKETLDYRDDLRKLAALSENEIHSDSAKHKKAIAIGGNEITVVRPIVEAMFAMAQKGSFLITGGAGDGKTGCQLSLAEKLEESGKKVLYWPADSLQQSSVHEMQTVLQLQHRWQELFEELGDGGYLIIDGLDALRDTESQGAYRKLMRIAMEAGMHVVASIRSFDLQFARDLHDLFRGVNTAPAQYANPLLSNVHHIQIPELEKEEFQQVLDRLPAVADILQKVPALEPITKNLFSLDLLCRLLSGGATVTDLTPISTQGELFELFWDRRIRSDATLATKMEAALESIIERMVADRKLQAPLGKIEEDARSALFSMEILRHPSMPEGYLPADDLIEFRHHLLFDYAAELLFIRKRRRELAAELSSEDTWGLFLRPSLILFQRYLWAKARKEFWEVFQSLESPSVPPLQRIPGYIVIAEETKEVSELDPLLVKGKDSDPSPIQGVVSALEFSAGRGQFTGKSQECWLSWATKLIATENGHLLHLGRRVLEVAATHHEKLSNEAKYLMNVAAIALVEFYWKQSKNSAILMRPLGWICKTIGTNKAASIVALRRGFDPKEMSVIGYQGGESIGFNVEHVWNEAPELVVEMFKTIFAHSEMDDSQGEAMGGQILSITSNKRQDFAGIGHSLAEKYPQFLEDQPIHATEALLAAVHAKLHQEHRWRENLTPHTVRWDEDEVSFIEDGSNSWDNGEFPDEEERMLESWENFLIGMKDRKDAAEVWDGIRSILTREPVCAALYRRLLRAAAQTPDFFAERVGGLLLNTAILLESETEAGAKECIAAFDGIETGAKTPDIEKIILGIDKGDFPPIDDNDEFLARYIPKKKSHLLLAIPKEKRSEAAAAFLSEFGASDKKDYDESDDDGFSRYDPTTDEAFLTRQGIKVGDESRALLKESEFLNLESKDITAESVPALFGHMEDFLAKLKAAQEIDPRLMEQLKWKITRGFKVIARSEKLAEPALQKKLRQHLEDVLKEPDKTIAKEIQEFDESSRYSSSERMTAADGLLAMIRKAAPIEDADRSLLQSMSRDPDPRVRYSLAGWLWTFLESWPAFVWETLERWVKEVSSKNGSRGVLKGAFLPSGWFWWLRKRDQARAESLLQELRQNMHGLHDEDFSRVIGGFLSALWCELGVSWAHDLLQKNLQKPEDHIHELDGAEHTALEILMPRNERRELSAEQKERTLKLIIDFINKIHTKLEEYKAGAELVPPEKRPKDLPSWVRLLANVVHNVSRHFHSATDDFAKYYHSLEPEKQKEALDQWWQSAEPLLTAMLQAKHPSIAFDLIKGLESVWELDMPRSLHWLRRITEENVAGGLAYEGLAADHTIGILQRILAEHRASLREGSALRKDFLAILDAYLAVGWKQAMRLAMQIESIFR